MTNDQWEHLIHVADDIAQHQDEWRGILDQLLQRWEATPTCVDDTRAWIVHRLLTAINEATYSERVVHDVGTVAFTKRPDADPAIPF